MATDSDRKSNAAKCVMLNAGHTPSFLSSSLLLDLTTVLTDPILSVMPIGR